MKRTVLCLMIGSIAWIPGCSRQANTPPGAATPGPAPGTNRLVVQLDWIPEPEHGGFYEAEALGYFKEAGVVVELAPGGPNAFGLQKLATGQAQIAQSDSTNALLAMAEGLPLIAVGAVFQNDPSVLMMHADNPVRRFEDLNGKTIMARPEWAFLPYLRKKYSIDFKIIPQNFSVSNFILDPNFIQQGFYIAEPFHIIKGGAAYPKFLYAWDAGFDAYTVLIANAPWAQSHPRELRAFLGAYIRGWRAYLEGDPGPAHRLIKAANSHNTDEFMAFSRKMIIDEKLVVGRGASDSKDIGRITAQRFQIQLKQLEELGIIPAGKLQVERVMTTEYLP